ncbi:MAG: acetyl-CoA carboxylase biotin carboxyl carrier protein [Eubacteriaceae bacterium]|nr:acetyl-CoA carboxylase biotin carboxyl carrier protein [Eubacteriaceae bacterium]
MIELEKIEGLVKILEASSLTEMTVRDGEFKITMSKLDNPPVVAAGAAVAPAPAAVSVSAEVKEEKSTEDDIEYIISPIVGTFYSAPAPDAAPFVRIGDHVKNGQTVCILEAMKLMNEIQTEFDCEIEAVLVSNEQKVEYGQPLFKVKKL